MPDCDYCDAEFVDEDAYLDHLVEQHQGELTAIDQRRVEDRTQDDPLLSKTAIVTIVISATVLAAFGAIFAFGDVGPITPGSGLDSLPDQGDSELLAGVETLPDEGTTHVAPGTDVEYDAMPPTSGNHYPSPAEAGFYEDHESAPALGHLVHSIEHGHIVVYYDPDGLDGDAEDHLRNLASEFTDTWGSVIAVPTPVEDPESTYVLTAWNHRLRMDEYDPDTVEAFLAEYLGRGPENPIR